MMKVVNKINLKLPFEKRIRIIDAWEYEEFGLRSLPILDKLEKDGLREGYPFFMCDGAIIESAPNVEMFKIVLENFLENDLVY